MKIGVVDRNILTKIYYRCLSASLILNLLHYLVDLVRPGSIDTESCKRVLQQPFFT